jgi:hypothetical protein
VIFQDSAAPEPYLGRAEALLAQGHYDQAVADLEQAAMGWIDGQTRFGLRLCVAYARCVVARPYLLPRFMVMARRTIASAGHSRSVRPLAVEAY